ncbi:MAG: lipoprotein [Pseudomonadota bacterium]
MKRIVSGILLTLAVSGCEASAKSSLENACLSNGIASDTVCACIADAADANLEPAEIDILIQAFSQDDNMNGISERASELGLGGAAAFVMKMRGIVTECGMSV